MSISLYLCTYVEYTQREYLVPEYVQSSPFTRRCVSVTCWCLLVTPVGMAAWLLSYVPVSTHVTTGREQTRKATRLRSLRRHHFVLFFYGKKSKPKYAAGGCVSWTRGTWYICMYEVRVYEYNIVYAQRSAHNTQRTIDQQPATNNAERTQTNRGNDSRRTKKNEQQRKSRRANIAEPV